VFSQGGAELPTLATVASAASGAAGARRRFKGNLSKTARAERVFHAKVT
jgi:hypothetical protein